MIRARGLRDGVVARLLGRTFRRWRGWQVGAWLLLACSVARGGTIHVDDDAPNDPGPGDPTVSDPLEDGSTEHPFDAIQEGINAAVPGDEVVVADGTYTGTGNKDLDFHGKAITVRSASGDPATCVIDCEGSGRGFYFHSGETAGSVVQGITIRNGMVTDSSPGGPYGGGIHCLAWSSPTLTDCIINGDGASSASDLPRGGGVYCSSSSPTLTDCMISGNSAPYGAGVYCHDNSSPTLTRCLIAGNSAFSSGPNVFGGGFYCYSSSPTLNDCTIAGNTASSSGYLDIPGGGVYCGSSSLRLTGCTIVGNRANRGGGVYCTYSSGTLTSCTISANTAFADQDSAYGGGMYCGASSPTMVNCTIRRNIVSSASTSYGGGIYGVGSSPTLTDCTISENIALSDDASGLGGGMYFGNPCAATLVGCAIWRNMASSGGGMCCSGSFASACIPTLANGRISENVAISSGGGISCSGFRCSPALTNCAIVGNTAGSSGGAVSCSSESSPTVTNCILWGDTPQEVYSSATPAVTYCDVEGGYTGPGNINVDPGFAFPGDLHLMAGSPCTDAGTNAPTGGLPVQDAEGNARPQDGNGDGQAVADMGAYEFNPAAPAIALDCTRIGFFIAEGHTDPQSRALLVRNAAGGTLSWALDWQAGWLQADTMLGESTGEVDTVTLTADASALTYGVYSTTVSVSDPQAVNSPRTVEVVLYANKTLHVPSDYATIQAAIDAAIAGDEVLVGDGVYTGPGNKDLDFHGKPMAVRSASGNQTACIIDCEGSGRGFYFHSGETAATIVAGLTIRNGKATVSSPGYYYGGGVYCYLSSPTLTDCTISGNAASSRGGGVYCYYSRAALNNCTIGGNLASSTSASYAAFGGGVYCSGFGPTLTNCTITGNAASAQPSSAWGGAVYCSGSSPTLDNCAITGNTASAAKSNAYGGAVCCSGSNPTLVDCQLSANTALSGNSSASGGAVYCYSSDPRLTSCTVAGNTAFSTYGGGGGVYCDSSSPTLTNTTMTGNVGPSGNALYCTSSSSPTLTNCAISGNFGYNGGAVYCSGSSPKLTNCILWGDTPVEIYVDSGTATVRNCDVQSGYTGTGNINVDPVFAFPGDFHLMPGSPCIDAGTNTPTGGLPAQDADGSARPLDGDGDGQAVADMGPYEFGPAVPTIAVGPSPIECFIAEGQGGRATLSIRNAGAGTLHWTLDWDAEWLQADTLQGESTGEVDTVTLTADASALSHGAYSTMLVVSDPQASNSPRSVEVVLCVNETLHVPSDYPTIQAAINDAIPGDEVFLADGVYTGTGNKNLDFHGKPITVRSASGDPALCIIDCEGSGRGFYFHSGETVAAVVAGLTIRNGRVGYGSPGHDYGGGVYCYSSSPTLTNCAISGNTTYLGAGMYCYSSSPTLTNCAITGNTASSSSYAAYGGGVYCSSSSPTLTGCTIAGNTATSAGGVFCSSSSPRLTNCTISANKAASYGGGVYCNNSVLMLTNCALTDNAASSYGGGMYRYDSVLTVTNCTLSGNAASSGGAVYCTGFAGSPLYLTNCILWADTPQELYVSSGTPVVTYCDVQGGHAGTGNINGNPVFVDPDGPDNDPSTWEDNDYRLAAGSPCIDAGDNGGVPAGVVADLDGRARFVDDPYTADTGNPGDPPRAVVDMGAYEVPFLRGDANCDGAVDFDDIDPFVRALIGQAAYEARYPGCPWLNGDIDGDADVNFDDISPFVRCLVHEGCP